MPNHCSNKLVITQGENPEGFARFKKVLLDNRKDNDQFDFNWFYPMPKELDGHTSPARVVSEQEYAEALARKEKGELDPFETLPITRRMQLNLISTYGCDNWYDWRVKNWGTKWGAYECSSSHDDNRIAAWFDTAWCPGAEWCQWVADEFDVTIHNFYSEAGMEFAGYSGYGFDANDDYSVEVEFSEYNEDTGEGGEPTGEYAEFLEEHGLHTGG